MRLSLTISLLFVCCVCFGQNTPPLYSGNPIVSYSNGTNGTVNIYNYYPTNTFIYTNNTYITNTTYITNIVSTTNLVVTTNIMYSTNFNFNLLTNLPPTVTLTAGTGIALTPTSTNVVGNRTNVAIIISLSGAATCSGILYSNGITSATAGNYWMGVQFVIGATNITACQVARQCLSGNNKLHTIALFTTNSVIASTTVNMAGYSAGDWVIAGIVDTPLIVGQTYILACDETVGDAWIGQRVITWSNPNLSSIGCVYSSTFNPTKISDFTGYGANQSFSTISLNYH